MLLAANKTDTIHDKKALVDISPGQVF